jgi:hypothetical protein
VAVNSRTRGRIKFICLRCQVGYAAQTSTPLPEAAPHIHQVKTSSQATISFGRGFSPIRIPLLAANTGDKLHSDPFVILSRLSDSDRTAIGAQLQHLTRELSDHKVVYWSTPKLLPSNGRRISLERAAVARIAFLQRPGLGATIRDRFGLSLWTGQSLSASGLARLHAQFPVVSAIYASPLDDEDAGRMREIIEALDRPFVLHLWDSLSGPLRNSLSMIWLVENASEVFVLSEPLRDDVAALGRRSDYLMFTRKPTINTAEPPVSPGLIRIGLIGLLEPYADGIRTLKASVDYLRSTNYKVDLTYVGRRREAERLYRMTGLKMRATGFVSASVRDRIMSSQHFGFLPGPAASPETDARSKYSVPSRLLDFLAVGLPLIGTLHPKSAAARFLDRFGLGGPASHTNPMNLAESVRSGARLDAWATLSASSSRAFGRITESQPSATLQLSLERVSTSTRHPRTLWSSDDREQ